MATERILLGLKDKKAKPAATDPALAELKAKSTLGGSPNTPKTGVKRQYTAPSPERAAQMQEAREAKRLKVAEAKNRPWLVIGIDFGVTFTGIAFVATTNESRKVEVIKQWSRGGRQNDLLEKVPSRYAYAYENPELKEDAWGYQVQSGMKGYSWFKLLLDEDSEPTEHDDPLLRQSAGQGLMDMPHGKTVEDLTADFLRRLYKHTQWFLGEMIGKGMVRETPCHYHFTVPATWSLKARKSTREAAESAGFGTRITSDVADKLSMIDEPEAAAIAAMKSTLEGFPKQNPFEIGQGVVVADLGGGTIDLVSYKILRMEPIQLEELCVGVGAKSGGTSIDRALHALMRHRYGDAFSSMPLTKIGPGSKFMEDFETIKRDFDGQDSNQTFEIHLKMRDLDRNDRSVPQYDFEEDEITLTTADMKSLFDVPVQQSLQLVLEQVKLINKRKAATIKIIILCGGLGSSPYMKIRFDQFCEEFFGSRIQVVKPLRPWSAVCKGAALRGLEESPILSRRSRHHYGFVVHVDFNEDIHDEEDAYQDELQGKRAKNQMKWAVKKDEKLKPGVKKEHRCSYTIPPQVNSYIGRERFYLCEDDSAPARYDSNVGYAGEISVQVTAKVLARERKTLADRGVNVRKEPVPLDVTLTFTMGSEKGILEVSATSGKTKLGDAEINYEANSEWARTSAEIIDAEG